MIRTSLLNLLIAIVLACGCGVVKAQQPRDRPSGDDAFRLRVEQLLDDDGLDRLQRARSLRDLVAEEEAAVTQILTAKWVEQLGGSKFRTRAEAKARLIESGAAAIASLEQGATDEDLERASNCLEVLVQFGKGEDEATATEALHAVQRLANSDGSRIRASAAKQFTLLTQTDEDRAVIAFEAAGARLYRDKTGDVRSITVLRGKLGDSQLKLIGAFPKVTRVTIRGEKITDVGITHLSRLPALTSISISNSRITDAGLEAIAAMKGLDRLSLGKGKFTNRGLRTLAESTNLRSLMLSDILITKDTVTTLNECANLGSISLYLTDVDDQGLAEIGGLIKLNSLSIRDSPRLTDQGLAHLEPLRLRSLSIATSPITPRSLERIGRISAITSLTLSGDGLTDDGLEHLAALKSLSGLVLTSDRITDQGLADVGKIAPLNSLTMFCSEVTDDGLAHLTGLNNLRTLFLQKCKITDGSVEHLVKLKSLAHLYLSGTGLTAEAATKIRTVLPRCKVSH